MAINFSGVYSQNFDTLAISGTELKWTNETNDNILSGWYLFNRFMAPIEKYGASNGISTTGGFPGGFYSFGQTDAEDRALGGVGSGNIYFGDPAPASDKLAGYIAVALRNNTGSTLEQIFLSFDGEQWRNSGNITTQSMVLQYGLGASFTDIPDSNWTRPGGNFDWISPVFTASAAAVDGNDLAEGRVADRGGTLTDLNWAANQILWIRWIELNDPGNDHGLAIDNFYLATPGVTITESGESTQVTEGGATDAYDIVLRTSPTDDVIVTLNFGTQVTVNQSVLTFTSGDWDQPQRVTVTAVDDDAIEGNHTATITHTVTSGDAAYDGLSVAPLTVSITDNDSPAAVSAPVPQSTSSQSVEALHPAIAVTDAAGGAIADGTPDFLTFRAIAGESAEQILTLRNTGNGPLRLFDLTLPDGFSLGTALPPSLAPGETARLPLRFTAAAPGTVSGIFGLRTNDPAIDLFNFPLLGTVEAAIAPSPCEALMPTAPDLDFVTPPRSPNLTLKGSDGNDTLRGSDGDDFLGGGGGNDQIFGGLGDDLILGAPATPTSDDLDRDELYGGEGRDRIGGGIGNDLIHSGQGDDFVHGGQGDDELWGDRGDDWLSGDDGDDTLYGGTNDPNLPDIPGRDTLLGGSGDDWLFGNQGDDVLVGGDGNDTLHGGQNDDILIGGDGEDWLFGDAGSDTLCGGAGADYFALRSDRGSTVTILDFEAGRDRLVLPTGLSFEALSLSVSDGFLSLSNGPDLIAKVANLTPNQLTAADVIASPF
jgi:hypothetical protein